MTSAVDTAQLNNLQRIEESIWRSKPAYFRVETTALVPFLHSTAVLLSLLVSLETGSRSPSFFRHCDEDSLLSHHRIMFVTMSTRRDEQRTCIISHGVIERSAACGSRHHIFMFHIFTLKLVYLSLKHLM